MELCACTMQNEKVKIEKEGISHERSGACESLYFVHCLRCALFNVAFSRSFVLQCPACIHLGVF